MTFPPRDSIVSDALDANSYILANSKPGKYLVSFSEPVKWMGDVK